MLKLTPRLRPCVLDATTAARLDGSDEVPAGASVVVIVAGWLRERLGETSRAQCLPRLRLLARRPACRRDLLLERVPRRSVAPAPAPRRMTVGRYTCLADRIAAYGRG